MVNPQKKFFLPVTHPLSSPLTNNSSETGTAKGLLLRTMRTRYISRKRLKLRRLKAISAAAKIKIKLALLISMSTITTSSPRPLLALPSGIGRFRLSQRMKLEEGTLYS
jgi:hypothetical protein